MGKVETDRQATQVFGVGGSGAFFVSFFSFGLDFFLLKIKNLYQLLPTV
jgi:hypothetical protein